MVLLAPERDMPQRHMSRNPRNMTRCPTQVALWLAEPASRTMFHQAGQVAALVGTFCKALIPGLLPLVRGGPLQR